MTSIPRLAWPLRFENGRAATVQQDSAEHKAQRIAVTCSHPVGSRLDDPTFGIPDQLMRVGGTDIGVLAGAIEASEPDISVHITTSADAGHDTPGHVPLGEEIHVHVLED